MSDAIDRDSVLAEPNGCKPVYDDLLEAVRAHLFWHFCEERNLGSFHEKMDLCGYAKWCGKKALGLPHEAEWKGVPRIVIQLDNTPERLPSPAQEADSPFILPSQTQPNTDTECP